MNPNEKLTSHNSAGYCCQAPMGGAWMWDPKQSPEDPANVISTSWPPRSYTCTFCGREFRSAQALGGHMNVHRRDRARFHPPYPTTGAYPTFVIPANTGLCFYQLPNPNGIFTGFDDAPLSASQYAGRRTLLGQPVCFQVTSSSPVSSPRICIDSIEAALDSSKRNNGNSNKRKDLGNEELDLELRLGHSSRKPAL